MNTQQTRHEIEYEWFPEAAYSDMASDFVNLVMVHKQELLVELYKRWNANIPNYHCPYDANDFQIDASLIGNIAGIIRITMPPALADGDFIRLYICHDTNFSNVRLYSVMIDCYSH